VFTARYGLIPYVEEITFSLQKLNMSKLHDFDSWLQRSVRYFVSSVVLAPSLVRLA
jgi:hypothetical protein